MRLPDTLPSQGRRFEAHILDIPPCCPISKNPRPGSSITIAYRPCEKVLEVADLCAYIHEYRGGLRADDGTIIVRDMEAMIHRIADDCACAVGVPVGVSAQLVIAPKQRMLLMVRGIPKSEVQL